MLPSTIPDKQQPQNIEAEEALLGATLIDPDNLIRLASLNILAEDFVIARYGWLWQIMLDLRRNSTPIDLLTITDELEQRNQLKPFGGPAKLTDLMSYTPDSQHAAAYAVKVKKCAVRRALIAAAGKISQMAFAEDIEAEEAISRATITVSDVARRNVRQVRRDTEQLGHLFLNKLEYMQEHGSGIIGLPTGLTDLDRLLGGLQKSDLIILAGRPGFGKSALALQIFLEAAKKYRARSLYCSREMSDESLYLRMLAYESGVDVQRLRINSIKDIDYPLIIDAASRLATYKDLLIIDDATSTIEAMKARALVEQDKGGLALVVVDYIQIVEPASGKKNQNRAAEIGEISQSLKRMARELNTPVIAISSLSRNCEYRTDKRPRLADLKESGDIEHDADVVLFMYRDDIYNPDTTTPNVTEINIAKQRQGPTGTISVYFKKHLTKFIDLEVRAENLEDWVK